MRLVISRPGADYVAPGKKMWEKKFALKKIYTSGAQSSIIKVESNNNNNNGFH
jgi:hypothetical protein